MKFEGSILQARLEMLLGSQIFEVQSLYYIYQYSFSIPCQAHTSLLL